MTISTIELNNYEFIRVSGPDTITFLQGQLSCDMEKLSPGLSLRGALCNLKGRVIADFRVLQQGEDCLLQTSTGMAETIMTTLAKYAVFSKLELSIAGMPRHPLGLMGDGCITALESIFSTCPAEPDQVLQTPAASLINIGGSPARYEIWFHAEALAATSQSLDALKQGCPTQWSRQDIQAGIVHVGAGISESYTPQLLNYDLSGVIDFNKGCYTGQEIVARMFYRGKAKKRLFLLAADVAIDERSAVIQRAASGNEPEFEIIAYANSSGDNGREQPDSGDHLLLAILNAAVADEGAAATLSLSNQPHSSLQIRSLPYTE